MIIDIRTALAANAVVNVLQGSIFEFVNVPSLVEIGIATDATGVLMCRRCGASGSERAGHCPSCGAVL